MAAMGEVARDVGDGLIVSLKHKHISLDTKIMEIGVLRSDLWAKTCFPAAILNFSIFLAGTIGVTSWFPQFLNSAYSITP